MRANVLLTPPRDSKKTVGIKATVRSFAKKLLERTENGIADRILADSLLINEINRLTEAVRKYSVKLDIVQRAIEIAYPDYEFKNPTCIAKLLVQGIENELQS